MNFDIIWDNWAITCAVAIVTPGIIQRALTRLQLFQPIYELSPESHKGKASTPTLGGISFLVVLIVGSALLGLFSEKILWIMGMTGAYALLGAIDDISALCRNTNKGLSAKQKFRAQNLIAIFGVFAYSIWISPLDAWQFALAWFLFPATTNATNLTDGVDGLLAGTSIVSLIGFWALFDSINMPEVQQLIQIMMLSLFGFLIWNLPKAKIFMGDTGSLAIGALLASLAISSGNMFVLIPLGAVYILETLSVMIQVLIFKRSKKRLLLMSPIHHHFELLGYSETKVLLIFWSFAVLCLVIFLSGLGWGI